jgi:anti-sigma-K factor RskA
MRNRRSGIVAVLLAFWAMLALADSVRADQAQQQNPLFAQAQALAAQVASSSASAEVKANFSQRFAALTAEQQDLWRLAGAVDAGQCTGDCANNYNNSVVAWQNELAAFSADASAAQPQGNAQVTLENHTSQTLDLYIDKQQQCRALLNLMCTAQTSSGFHVLVATSGDTVVDWETATLQPGDSYTFSVL